MLAGVPKTGGGLWAEGERERARAGLPAGRRWGCEVGERRNGGEGDRWRRNAVGHTGRRAGRWRQTQGRRETQTHPEGGRPGGAGRGVSREGNVGVRSVGGVAGRDTRVPGPRLGHSPRSPQPSKREPRAGARDGRQGTLDSRSARGTPRCPHDPGRVQGSAPPGDAAAFHLSLSSPRPSASAGVLHSRLTHAAAGLGPSPSAAPLPAPQTQAQRLGDGRRSGSQNHRSIH